VHGGVMKSLQLSTGRKRDDRSSQGGDSIRTDLDHLRSEPMAPALNQTQDKINGIGMKTHFQDYLKTKNKI